MMKVATARMMDYPVHIKRWHCFKFFAVTFTNVDVCIRFGHVCKHTITDMYINW